MKDITERLNAARQRQGDHYFNGFIHAYCDNTDCTGRRFQIQIKTYGADDPVTVRCPLCGKVATPDVYAENVIETLDEYFAREAREARCNVNEQRYKKKNDRGRGPVSFPVSVMFDDSLPE